jgi:hypothetical protein
MKNQKESQKANCLQKIKHLIITKLNYLPLIVFISVRQCQISPAIPVT